MLCMRPPDRLRKHLELMLHINLLWGFWVLLVWRITSLVKKYNFAIKIIFNHCLQSFHSQHCLSHSQSLFYKNVWFVFDEGQPSEDFDDCPDSLTVSFMEVDSSEWVSDIHKTSLKGRDSQCGLSITGSDWSTEPRSAVSLLCPALTAKLNSAMAEWKRKFWNESQHHCPKE